MVYSALQLITRGREDGITTVELGRKTNYDQKTCFYLIKQLVELGLMYAFIPLTDRYSDIFTASKHAAAESGIILVFTSTLSNEAPFGSRFRKKKLETTTPVNASNHPTLPTRSPIKPVLRKSSLILSTLGISPVFRWLKTGSSSYSGHPRITYITPITYSGR